MEMLDCESSIRGSPFVGDSVYSPALPPVAPVSFYFCPSILGIVPQLFLLTVLDREPMVLAPCEYARTFPGLFASDGPSIVLFDT